MKIWEDADLIIIFNLTANYLLIHFHRCSYSVSVLYQSLKAASRKLSAHIRVTVLLWHRASSYFLQNLDNLNFRKGWTYTSFRSQSLRYTSPKNRDVTKRKVGECWLSVEYRCAISDLRRRRIRLCRTRKSAPSFSTPRYFARTPSATIGISDLCQRRP